MARELKVRVGLDSTKLQAGLARVRGSLASVGKSIGRIGIRIGQAMGLAVAAGIAATAKNVLQLDDALAKLEAIEALIDSPTAGYQLRRILRGEP